eukprot:14270942-Alexandrium_andersonii.AAC.1
MCIRDSSASPRRRPDTLQRHGSNKGVLRAGSLSEAVGGNAASPATSPLGGDEGELCVCSPSQALVPTAA